MTSIKEYGLKVQSALASRVSLAASLGKSFGGDRDLYSALGYPRQLKYDNMLALYERDGLATRIVDAIADETWRERPVLLEGDKKGIDETDDTGPLQQAFSKLAERLDLYAKFHDVDVDLGISRFSLMFLGMPGDPEKPAKKGKLHYVTVHDEGAASIDDRSIVEDPESERFGLPEYYFIEVASKSGTTRKRVHYSRVVHVKEGRDKRANTLLYGVPRIQNIVNRLMDLEKVIGGSSEAFWLLIYRGFALTAKDDMTLPAPDTPEYEDMQDEIEEYMHGLRRYMRLQGLDVKDLGGKPGD